MKKFYSSFLFFLIVAASHAQYWDKVGFTFNTSTTVAYTDTIANVLYVGGSFNTSGLVRIAQWDGANYTALGAGCDAEVKSIIRYNGDIYAGGTFTVAGGVICNRIAKWNGSTWSAMVGGITGSTVNAMCVYNGELYVAGYFSSAGGVSVSHIAKWNGSTWSAVGSGVNSTITSMVVYNGELHVGGNFTTAGGNTANYLAKWNGSTWSAVGTGTNLYVDGLFVQGGNLYVGGRFTTAGGNAANYIAKWNGTAFSAVGTGMDTYVYSISYYNGELYAGGIFNTAGGVSAGKIARWNGSSWTNVNEGFNGEVRSMTVYKGQLYAAGTMGYIVPYFARWDNTAPGTNRFQKVFKGANSSPNSESVYDVEQTYDWGYVIAGHTTSFGQGNGDAYIIKTDTAGVKQWAKVYGASTSSTWETARAVVTASDGSMVTTGLKQTSGNNDVLAIGIDKDGNSTWVRTYGTTANEQGWDIKQLSDGTFVMAGTTSSASGLIDPLLVKCNAAGNVTWAKKFVTSPPEDMNSLELTSSGGFILAGTNGSSPNYNIHLLNADANGNALWDRSFGGTGEEKGYFAKQTKDGGFITGGYTTSYVTGTQMDAYLIKLTSAGNIAWSKTYSTPDYDQLHSIEEKSDGTFLATGAVLYVATGRFDFLAMKLASDGSLISAMTYGGPEHESTVNMDKTSDGGFVVVGQTNSFPYSGAADFNIYMIKADSLLNSGSCHQSNITPVVTSVTSSVTVPGAAASNAGLTETAIIITETTAPFTPYELQMSLTVSKTNVSCNGGSNGQASVSVQGGFKPYTYLWSNGNSTTAISNLTANIYSITVTDSTLCSATQTVSITQPTAINFTGSTTSVTCNGGTNASINGTTTGGTSPYTYAWSPGGYTTEDISGLGAATYSLLITDGNGCTKQQTVQINQPAVLTATVSKNEGACGQPNSMNAVNTGGTTPYSYLWSTGSTNDSLFNQLGGNYSYTVTDSHNCKTSATTTFAILVWQPVPICMVTVDTNASAYNTIVWEKPVTNGIDSFFIYRNISNVMTKIGAVPYSAISIFVDNTPGVDPKAQAHEYGLSVLDTCGNESTLSPTHQTIHQLAPNYTFPPHRFDLSWSHYQGFSFSDYEIWRDTIGNNSWHLIGLVPSSLSPTYSDFTAPHDSCRYRIQITPAQPCVATIKNPMEPMATSVKSGKSNTSDKLVGPTGVNEVPAAGLLLSPNPNNGSFELSIPKGIICGISLYNILGETVYSRKVNSAKLQVSLPDIPPGVYQLKVQTSHGMIDRKVLISR